MEYLDFEKPIKELEDKIKELSNFASRENVDLSSEIKKLQKKMEDLKQEIFGNLDAYQKTKLARHFKRPYFMDYASRIFSDFVELHGDRLYSDDRAIIAGLAKIDSESVVVIGHRKGRDVKENMTVNFGMAHPEGYRKAQRMMFLAEKFQKPLLCFIDTPGAYPGIGAEERGQAEAIARSLAILSELKTPVIAVITGEGGSGGALAMALADRVLMLEHSIYSVISPEGCSAILWKTSEKVKDAASALKLTAQDLKELGIIDEIVPEPLGGAHRDYDGIAGTLKRTLIRNINELKELRLDELIRRRQQKFRLIGYFEDDYTSKELSSKSSKDKPKIKLLSADKTKK
jgi:acetyl-CoA carboxylase carboxyl transferase subunit alpha